MPAVSPVRPAGHLRVDKRDAILRAATEVFAARGFFNAQVADVARAAGIAAGTVYLYFKSKDDLLVSIFEQTVRDAIDQGRATVAPLKDPVEQLRAIARVHLERMGRDAVLVGARERLTMLERQVTQLERDLRALAATPSDLGAAL